MAYVDVPKDLTNIKTKFIGNFTKRQCVCFGLGILVGFPGYFIARGAIGTTAAFYVLIALMAPFSCSVSWKRTDCRLKSICSTLSDICLPTRRYGWSGLKIFMSITMKSENRKYR